MAKLLIFGTRYFDDEKLMHDQLYYFVRRIEHKGDIIDEVVSGGNKTWVQDQQKYIGADYLGEQWAKKHGIPVKIFPADWSKHGNSAGPIRNKLMSVYVGNRGYAIGFWDELSRGTKGMIALANSIGITTEVVRYLQLHK